MSIQIVMDRSGDTRHQFDQADPVALKDARDRFDDLTKQGYRAVALNRDGGHGRLLNEFDDTAERTLFIPHLKGG